MQGGCVGQNVSTHPPVFLSPHLVQKANLGRSLRRHWEVSAQTLGGLPTKPREVFRVNLGRSGRIPPKVSAETLGGLERKKGKEMGIKNSLSGVDRLFFLCSAVEILTAHFSNDHSGYASGSTTSPSSSPPLGFVPFSPANLYCGLYGSPDQR